ncbi:MAG TPA: hypothetical protein VEM94_03305 [Candidatus Dormibacteraeota bacterium]|nr:hypothetical protein [Candidatus Dormibacteraeota bacterium]
MTAPIKLIPVLALLVALTAACDPFGLPATRALESGVQSMLSSANSFELAGDYTADGTRWTIDMQLTRPATRHVTVKSSTNQVEAIIIGGDAYFRGQAFLAKHLGTDPLSQSIAKAAGNAWWKDTAGLVPSLPDLTDGAVFRTNFLGPAVTTRTDHQPVGGVDAVKLSGVRADVYIASTAPYELLRVHLKEGVVVDGITDADLRYTKVDRDFGINAPSDVLNFSNLSTLPPIYTVVSVDTSTCASQCIVSAKLKNLGGATGARAASTIVFTMSDPVSKQVIGTCSATVQPDVGYNATTTVSCTINGRPVNAAVVTAVADNPGRG